MRLKKLYSIVAVSVVTTGVLAGCTGNEKAQEGSKEVNLYSARHYDVDKEIYKKFEQETGIKVNVVEGKGDELVERLSREGEKSSADLILTVGAENLSTLKSRNLLKEFTSKTINENIPEDFRGKEWTALSSRARVIAYDKSRVKPDTIKTYNDLLKPEFKGKVLTRSSSSSYSVALVSSFLQEHGKVETEKWVKGLKENFAREPKGNDRDQIKAIAAGEGDVAIVNSYYVAKMINSSDNAEKEAVKNIGLIFPENSHVNISFGGLTSSSKNTDNAIKLLEFLTKEEAQGAYAKENGEFPLNKKVALPELQKSWGEFKAQDVNFEQLGSYAKDGVIMMDVIGWK